MAVLVIADHDNAALSDATAKTVTAAKVFGGDVDVLVAGKGAGEVAAAAATSPAPLPATRTSTSPPKAFAAVTVFAVASDRAALS